MQHFSKCQYIRRILNKETMTENQQQALCEVILNVYKGTFPLTKYYIKTLSPYRNTIYKLSSKTVKKSVKRNLLLQEYTILLILIKPYLGVLNDVSGVTSSTKRKVWHASEIIIKRRKKSLTADVPHERKTKKIQQGFRFIVKKKTNGPPPGFSVLKTIQKKKTTRKWLKL